MKKKNRIFMAICDAFRIKGNIIQTVIKLYSSDNIADYTSWVVCILMFFQCDF